MDAKTITQASSFEEVIDAFLYQARRVAPGFNVPYMVPYVCVEPTQESYAGAFVVDQEGWVKISILETCSVFAEKLPHKIRVCLRGLWKN